MHLLRATNLRGYRELVRELGGDPAPLLARFHIAPELLQNDEAFIPYRSSALLLEASAHALQCPDFGLRLVQWQGLDILGPVAVIARNAETVLASFTAIARYLHLHSPALRLSLDPELTQACHRLIFEIIEPNLPLQSQSFELSMANGAKILQLLVGSHARPDAIYFTHPQSAQTSAYRRTFGCPVHFEQSWCGFLLSVDLARLPIDAADPETRRLLSSYLESQYAPGSGSLSQRVSELIRRLLPTGHCCAEVIAEQLAMHPRSLQRRLQDEDLRYDMLLDTERRECATRYLAQSGLHLSQITGLLGYTEQSTFTRACRRWFGTTPRRYRLQLQSSTGAL